jgi:four helix bundle protein
MGGGKGVAVETSNVERRTSNVEWKGAISRPGREEGNSVKKHRTLNIEHRTLSGSDEWLLHDGESGCRKYNLEERLLEFAAAIIDLSEKLPSTRAGNHVAGQVLRSGTSPYPNHGEAESAESREDFVHKFKVCLKELRETRRWARLIEHKRWTQGDPTLMFVLNESDELIRIFMSSIRTAQHNALKQDRQASVRPRRSHGEAG